MRKKVAWTYTRHYGQTLSPVRIWKVTDKEGDLKSEKKGD